MPSPFTATRYHSLTIDPETLPADFVVTATSSGSRGVYGAIGTAGEWGLKKGCTVAYTDKGSGMGFHDLQNNTVNLINGVRADAAVGYELYCQLLENAVRALTKTAPRLKLTTDIDLPGDAYLPDDYVGDMRLIQ